MNLNMGAGSNRKQDYVSVDLYNDASDLKIDVAGLLPFEDESIDNIYACHVVEHLSRQEWEQARSEWVRILKENGTIEIRCPDIIKVCEKLIQDPELEWNYQMLYGLQINDGEYHKNGFTEQKLIKDFIGLDAEVLAPSTDYELHMKFTKTWGKS